MNIRERINTDFMEAFKSKNMEKKNLLGVLKGEIQNEEGRGTVITDEVVTSIVKKMEKSLKQTNTEESLKELTYIECYLPTMMSEEKISEIVNELIASGLNNVGQIMGAFNKDYKGMADNQVVSKIAKTVLS